MASKPLSQGKPPTYTGSVQVGTLELTLRIYGAESLKDRRRVVRTLVARLRNTFNVAVADLDQEPQPRSACIAVVSVGNDSRYLDGQLTAIVEFVESLHLPLEVMQESREIIHV